MKIRKAEKKDIPRILALLGQVLQIHAELRPDIFIDQFQFGFRRICTGKQTGVIGKKSEHITALARFERNNRSFHVIHR